MAPIRYVSLRRVATFAALALTVWAVLPTLTTASRPLRNQPAPDSDEYADGAWQLAHGGGYVTFFNDRTNEFGDVSRPVRFPFGFSVVLAPFAAVIDGFPHAEEVGARVVAVSYVLVIVAAAWSLGGWLAAALAALLVGISPFAEQSATLIMSDALGALLAVIPLIVLKSRSRASALLVGAATGAGMCVHLLSAVALPAALVAAGEQRRRLFVVAGVVPFVAALGINQWATFGSPFRTGYSYYLPHVQEFGLNFLSGHVGIEGPYIFSDKLNGALMNFVCPCGIGGSMAAMPNITFYPASLLGLFWVFAPPLSPLIGAAALFRLRSTPAAHYGMILIALNMGLVLVYFTQGVRFIAPAASVLLVYTAVGSALALRRGWELAAPPAAAYARGWLRSG